MLRFRITKSRDQAQELLARKDTPERSPEEKASAPEVDDLTAQMREIAERDPPVGTSCEAEVIFSEVVFKERTSEQVQEEKHNEMAGDVAQEMAEMQQEPNNSEAVPPKGVKGKGTLRRVNRLKAEVIAMRDRFRARRATSAPGDMGRAAGAEGGPAGTSGATRPPHKEEKKASKKK